MPVEARQLSEEPPDPAALDDAWLLGCALTRYQVAYRLDDAPLALLLGISPEELDELRRCPRPWPDPHGIRLARIANAFTIDVQVLAHVITFPSPSVG